MLATGDVMWVYFLHSTTCMSIGIPFIKEHLNTSTLLKVSHLVFLPFLQYPYVSLSLIHLIFHSLVYMYQGTTHAGLFPKEV